MKLTPAFLYVTLLPEFSSCRRTPELHERCVGSIPKFQQVGVHRPNLPSQYARPKDALLPECAGMEAAGLFPEVTWTHRDLVVIVGSPG